MTHRPPARNLVIFDLDGTLANGDHRVGHITKGSKDWKTYFAECGKDKLIPHTAALFYLIRRNPNYEVWIVSGRSDEVRSQTEYWLQNHSLLPDKLIMRPAGDYTNDDVLKASWVTTGVIPKERILMVFDDRDRVVKAWRKLGLPCFQVAEGDF